MQKLSPTTQKFSISDVFSNNLAHKGLYINNDNDFVNFILSGRIREDNFYRRLKNTLDLEYLRPMTIGYYGSEGHKSIDPVCFLQADARRLP